MLACNPLKKIPEGKYFLHKSKVESDSGSFKREDLISLLRQKQNRKILGVARLHLGLYTLGNSGDTTVHKHKGLGKLWNGRKIKRGLRNIGEEPVILDTVLTEKSREQLEIYAQSKGYFHATVTDSVYLKKKKAKVVYTIHSQSPYIVRNISYASSDEGLQQILNVERKNSEIDSGKIYDADVIDQERNRVTASIRDHGYYFFNRNYITYELDSSLASNQVDIYMYVNRQFENVDPATAAEHPQEDHHKYRLNNIYVFSNFNSLSDEIPEGMDTTELSNYFFVDNLQRDYLKKETLLRFIFMKKGDEFYQKDVDYTYTRLAELNIFKFINFRFVEVPRDSLNQDYLLDVHIQLTPLQRQEYKLESELTHNGGNLGVAGSITYANKNLVRGAESLELKLSGGLESLRNFADTNVTKRLLFFNTYDFGPEVSLGFKKFLIPGFIERNTSRYFNPKTLLTVGSNYQERPDFKRVITKFSFGYQWQPSIKQRLQYFPFEINSVNVRNSPEFEHTLIETGDQSLIYSYKNHLITSGRFNWAFTNQGSRIGRSYYFLRINVETAGNTLYWYSWANNVPKDTSEKRYTVFGNIFSQYVKVDADLVYHMRVNYTNNIVYRIAGGIGYTYGNSENLSLPFDKAFFIGGANDLRAWHARTLGPGSYEDPSNIENGGDIKILSNIEYRSSLFKRIEAAAFIDAGNVWLLNDKQTTLTGALFDSKKFLSQIAVGVGLGIRFNFNFFIIRTDFGLKLLNPALPGLNRWEYSQHKFVIGQVVPNLAIGYPF
jgi:outer membrane protein assembly factor BamA